MKSSGEGIFSTLKRATNLDYDEIDIEEKGTMKFKVHMKSKYGTVHECNYDNFYLNGIFMDTFRFKDITKDITAADKFAVFAVSSGKDSDRSSKIVLKCLNKQRNFLGESKNVSELKKRLEECLEFCMYGLVNEGIKDNTSHDASLSVVAFFKGVILYSIIGTGVIAVKNKSKVKIFNAESNEVFNGQDKKYTIKTYDIKSGDIIVLCSDGIPAGMKLNDISYSITAEEELQNIVDNLIKKTSFTTNNDATCVAVKSEFKPFIKLRTKIIMVACALVILANLINLFLG